MQKHPWIQTVIGSCLAFFVTASWGQPSPAQLQMQQQQQINNMLGEVQTQDTLRRQGVINQQQNAARLQAWQAKENAIQAQIERYRSTPYYGSLAVNPKNFDIYVVTGKISEQSSANKALELCGDSKCKILKTFANSCAAVTYPIDSHEFFVVVDRSPQKAVSRAATACASKYGVDGCTISRHEGGYPYAACSGYEYGAYTKK